MEQKFKREDISDNIAKSVKKRPDTSKKKKKNNSVFLLFLGIILGIILGVIIAIVAFDKDENESKTSIKETEQYIDVILDEEGFIIETPVVDLQYPKKWNDIVRIEQIEGDFHTVQFFVTVEGKDEIQIFDILFGGEEGYTLGYLKGENDEQISVNIVSYDLEFGEEWTQDEKNIIYAMMEDVNYIIGMLQKEAGFELAQ